MVFTLIFQTACIDLNEEDGRELHHSHTYSAKSLMRMGYHLFDGYWKRKISGQKVVQSFSEDEEEENEEQHPNIEFVTEVATETFV